MKHVLVFALLFASLSVHAFVFVEPMFGYGIGKMKEKIHSTSFGDSTLDPSIKGTSYGLRGGLSLLGLQLGGEMVRNDGKATGGGLDEDLDITSDEYAAFLGYRLAFIRPYVGYIFRSQLTHSSSKKGGTGFKVGGTFYALSHVALSLEYRSVSFDKEPTDDGDYTIDYNTTALMLSFPFEI